ncbi:hypothetical protein [Dictyobacter arantiisoli]|uniref:Uncharacterized protein n=1 Tax=Dictyobacter arantiisoli TaxID=2014874 RepID=A0A5A5THN4_9CHLR|nr:hypothetical protein [Dictyobacter arantiisoli]GCF10539.1 hypothetical protein KDI_41030 [Dictyobacter arantiisoli]
MQQHPSDVVRLLELISTEYDAARRGLSGTAMGVSQHQFITAKMERMELLHQELRTHVGEQAMALIAQTLDSTQNEASGGFGNHDAQTNEQR